MSSKQRSNRWSVLLTGLGFLLVSGLALGIAVSLPEKLYSQTSTADIGQELPISAEANVAGETIALEVAKTQQQQAMGLMFRDSLAPDRGMLFTFERPQPASFWMKNVKLPLDMIFLRDGKVKAIAAAPPCRKDPCPTYGAGTIVDQVIELRGGRATELGLQVGDRIELKFLESPQPQS